MQRVIRAKKQCYRKLSKAEGGEPLQSTRELREKLRKLLVKHERKPEIACAKS